jgi:hypothetical protein
VLVRTHAQGSELKRELATLNVGSVELSQASVFQSPDAEEVERVLIAINQPSRDTLLRGALATEMMGCDAARIAEISGNETEVMGYLQRFADYRDLWLRQGVGVMYRRLLSEQKVSARMLRRTDGERRLTNLLHLGDRSMRRRDAPITGRAAALAGNQAPRRLRRRSRAAALESTAISSRLSPSTRQRASSSRSCSARFCGTGATDSARPTPKAGNTTTTTEPRSSTSARTTRSATTWARSPRRSSSRSRRNYCASSTLP